jgi:deazaflavin-dependent oxidoreductase (nitroreductase family)
MPNDFSVRLLMGLNVAAYRLTGGVLGGSMAGQSVLLLHTVGRKSGRERITPVNYFRDGERYVLVASNWGLDRQPAWYWNLLARPEPRIQVRSKVIAVQVREAAGADYDRLWKLVTARNDFYSRYQQQTKRKIPLLLLEPIP